MKIERILALLIILGGCMPVGQRVEFNQEQIELAWPKSAEQRRVVFTKLIAEPGDVGIKKTSAGRLMDFLAGREERLFMIRPYALAVHETKIVVGDPGVPAVHVLDPAKNGYQLITGAGDASFVAPVGLELSKERIFVADSVLRTVFVLDHSGKLIRKISGFERPTGLAYDSQRKRLYVADTLAHRVMVFTIDGEKIFEFGARGAGSGEFNFPSHLSITDDQLLVNDNMNFRIQIFDLNGEFISMFGTHGDGSGHLSQPKGVAMDSGGHIYVAGATIDRVQIFSQEGNFLLAFGAEGVGPGEFKMPAGLVIDNNRIYVADSLNSRIQVFDYVGDN